jgi:hypothetical protein
MKQVSQMTTIGAAVTTTASLITKSAEQVSLISKNDDCEFVKLRFFGIHKQVCDEALAATGNLSITTRVIGICAAVMLIMSVLITNRVFESVFIRWDARSAIRWIRRVDPSQARQLFFASKRSDDMAMGVEIPERYSHPENQQGRDPYSHSEYQEGRGVSDLLEQQRIEYERQLAMQRDEFERLLTEQRREMLHMQRGGGGQEGERFVDSAEKV